MPFFSFGKFLKYLWLKIARMLQLQKRSLLGGCHPSVSYSDDIIGGTGMTEEGGAAVLDEKAGSQCRSTGMTS
ncbi:hypothetical protein [Wolbachia endosymbiont (group A) of Longitarsus flavicornis]|uniref:hypothetical protein n=1 Tax=Wolbachia endosymbiont (group A) of Longitarsus flavicornis TaxID=3066134 RepID=UPI0030CA5562